MRNKSAPLKWSKLWRDVPQPCDYFGAYTTEQLERMTRNSRPPWSAHFARVTRVRWQRRQRMTLGADESLSRLAEKRV
jgi:hypothetical protein